MKKDNQELYSQQQMNTRKESAIIISKKRYTFFPYIIVFCIPVLLYLQTISFGFTHFDDNGIISNNIAFLSNISNWNKAFFTDQFITGVCTFYRPLGTVSYMFDVFVSGGNNLWMYHLTNILLLGAIACALYMLLKTFRIPSLLALISTLVYCSHPLFVSTVAHLPNRAELLLVLFTLLSFVFLIDYLQNGKLLYLLLHWVTFSLALFSKETAAFLPLLFIAYYFSFSFYKQFEKKHLFSILYYAIIGALWLWLRHNAISSNHAPTQEEFGLLPLLSNVQVIPECIAKLILPYDFAPIPSFSTMKTVIGIVLLGIIVFVFIKNRKQFSKQLVFCLFWFALLLVPSMLFKHPYIDYLDHRFFLPLIGIVLFVLILIPRNWMDSGMLQKTLLCVAVILCLGALSFIKYQAYSDPITFYNTAISQNQNSAIAYYNRGTMRVDKSDFQGAIDDFSKAVANYPNYAEAYNNRGMAKSNIGDNQGSLEDFKTAIAINHQYDMAYLNRGNAYLSLGEFQKAITDYNAAIAIHPNYANAFTNRGYAKYMIKDFQSAIDDYDKAIEMDPNFTNAYNCKGALLAETKNFQEALSTFDKAVKSNPENVYSYLNRATVKISLHDYYGAMGDCDMALKLHPDYDAALNLKTQAQLELQKTLH